MKVYRKEVSNAGSLSYHSITRRLAAALLLGAFLFGLNVHLFLLQLFGWSGMLLDYHQETGSWVSAIEQTIQGETPCSVCIHVETALNADERRSDSTTFGPDNRILPPLLLPLARTIPPVEPPLAAHALAVRSSALPVSPLPDSKTPPPRNAAA